MNPYEGLGFGHKGSFQSSDDDDDDDDDDVPQALKSISTFEARNLPLDFDDRERDTNVVSGHRNIGFPYMQRAENEKIKNLFQYIECYTPREVVIGTFLRPFIPDYIPAVGSVDEFIKVPRPDGVPDFLGLKVLDESGPIQSDPAVVALKIRAATMQSSHHPIDVASIEGPERNPQKVDAWIESMRDLHRSKPLSSVIYSKPMPDIEQLMEGQSKDIETALAEMQFQSMHEDNESLSTFVDFSCSVLGIPVYKSQVESLHCAFTLFLELKKHSC